jgi:hypothetical protein
MCLLVDIAEDSWPLHVSQLVCSANNSQVRNPSVLWIVSVYCFANQVCQSQIAESRKWTGMRWDLLAICHARPVLWHQSEMTSSPTLSFSRFQFSVQFLFPFSIFEKYREYNSLHTGHYVIRLDLYMQIEASVLWLENQKKWKENFVQVMYSHSREVIKTQVHKIDRMPVYLTALGT